MLKRKKKLFEKNLLTNEIQVAGITKIAMDLSNTRIKNLSICVDEFLVKECNVFEFIGNQSKDGVIRLNYTTKNFRKLNEKDIKLKSEVIFTGKRKRMYRVIINIRVKAICVNNNYDALMKDYAYEYMRNLLGSSEILTKLGFNESLLVDIEHDEFQKTRFDGFVEAVDIGVDLNGKNADVEYVRTEPDEIKEPTEEEIREDTNNKVIVGYFDKHKNGKSNKQMYVQAMEDQKKSKKNRKKGKN